MAELEVPGLRLNPALEATWPAFRHQTRNRVINDEITLIRDRLETRALTTLV